MPGRRHCEELAVESARSPQGLTTDQMIGDPAELQEIALDVVSLLGSCPVSEPGFRETHATVRRSRTVGSKRAVPEQLVAECFRPREQRPTSLPEIARLRARPR